MSRPELDILRAVISRLDRLHLSVAGDLDWLGGLPSTLIEFETMASHRQSAARAVLKSFELIEDQLARAFRVIPRLLGEDSGRWFARDHADYMERLGILDAAASWMPIVKLRNELVHDYPLDPAVQFNRFTEAVGYLPRMADTRERLARFVRDDMPAKLP